MEKADAHRSIDPWPAKTGGGERREIGPGTQASFSTGEWAERFDPEGPKNPKGERRLDHPKKTLD